MKKGIKILGLLIIVIAFLSILLVQAESNPPSENQTPLPKLIAQYVAADNDGNRMELLTEIKKSDVIKSDEVKKWYKIIWDNINKKAKCGKYPETILNSKQYQLKYFINGKPAGKASSLIIYLHGGGNVSGINDQGWAQAKDLVKQLRIPAGLVPRVLDDNSPVGWAETSGILSVIEMLKEFKRTYPVDTNQVYLGGYSMGGWGTPIVGAINADYFAGLFGFGGGTDGNNAKAIMHSLYNTPISINIGQQDTDFDRLETSRMMRDALKELQAEKPKGYVFEYKEYPGQGHFVPGAKEHSETGKWLQQFKRNPYPSIVAWTPLDKFKKYFYWLKIDKPFRGVTINAEIKADNRIEITTQNVGGITVFLNEKLVNLSKPVTVVVNGTEKFSGKVEYSLSALLETLTEKEDANMYFTARVDIAN
ncbi:MAG: hypothetical protein HY811_06370 [Planctomycetes bacterium]|nr:hypothetical protein [Planctomycetota bacterium]